MLRHSPGLAPYDQPRQKGLESYHIGREEKGFRDTESWGSWVLMKLERRARTSLWVLYSYGWGLDCVISMAGNL